MYNPTIALHWPMQFEFLPSLSSSLQIYDELLKQHAEKVQTFYLLSLQSIFLFFSFVMGKYLDPTDSKYTEQCPFPSTIYSHVSLINSREIAYFIVQLHHRK